MIEANIELVERFIRAVERGDTEALEAYLTPDFVHIERPNAVNPHGQRRDLKGTIDGAILGQSMLDWQRFEIQNILGAGDWVAVESEWVAKLSHAVGTMPKGYEMKAHLAMFVQIRDGKISEQRNYDSYEKLP